MISIIIPTYNEARTIITTLSQFVGKVGDFELIVVDGYSNDGTRDLVERFMHTQRQQASHTPVANITILIPPERGRANQMNAGARQAKGDVVLFLHADTILPPNWDQSITTVITQGSIGGAFCVSFPTSMWWYRGIELFSNFRARFSKIYHGDQAIFVQRDVFLAFGGYPNIPIMEDPEISKRMRQSGSTSLINNCVITAHRRIEANGFWKSVLFYMIMKTMYRLGISPHKINQVYKHLKKE